MTLISYTLGIPAATHNPSADQPQMKINNDNNASIWGVDHFGFNAGTNNSGTHSQVTLTNQAAPGFAGGNGVLYANLVSGQSWPFWQNALGSTQILGGTPTAAQSGKTFLPGGIVLIWDKITAGLNTNNLPITFPLGGFPTNCFSVVLQYAADDNSTIRMGIDSTVLVTNTGFQTQQTATSHLKAIYYIAIGN